MNTHDEYEKNFNKYIEKLTEIVKLRDKRYSIDDFAKYILKQKTKKIKQREKELKHKLYKKISNGERNVFRQ